VTVQQEKPKRLRHVIPVGESVCACKLTHTFEINKRGFCACTEPGCERVHRA
jgi:hypothetical protein